MSRMPITSAATSMSRTAIHERPTFPRAMFLAASAITVTIDKTRIYLAAGVMNGYPRITTCCAVITPDAL